MKSDLRPSSKGGGVSRQPNHESARFQITRDANNPSCASTPLPSASRKLARSFTLLIKSLRVIKGFDSLTHTLLSGSRLSTDSDGRKKRTGGNFRYPAGALSNNRFSLFSSSVINTSLMSCYCADCEMFRFFRFFSVSCRLQLQDGCTE